MPLEIEYVNGMSTIVRNAGMRDLVVGPVDVADLRSSSGSRRPPAPATAASNGTIVTSGVKNIASRNSTPVTTLASAGPGALGDAGRRLDVRRVATRRDAAPPAGRGERVDQQDLAESAAACPSSSSRSRLVADADHRAHGVEEVGEHQREDEQQRQQRRRPRPKRAEQREVAEQRAGRASRRPCRAARARSSSSRSGWTCPADERRADVGDRLHDDRQDRRDDDADQDRAPDLAHDQHAA